MQFKRNKKIQKYMNTYKKAEDIISTSIIPKFQIEKNNRIKDYSKKVYIRFKQNIQ